MNKDSYFIKKTFSLAQKADGFTSPNPLVGAVIVKNEKIISSGYHKCAGANHAEIEAINKAEESLNGAVLYINLEPCCHFGRTPPCVDKIITSGIKRVVIAVKDPNPIVNGRSIEKLKAQGIDVAIGVLAKEAEKLNEIFFTNIKKKRPFVAVKTAQTLDGKIASCKGHSKWITQDLARIYAKKLRDKYDAILIGVNTVIKDDPALKGFKRDPYKVIIDPSLRIPLNSKLIKNSSDKLIIIASSKAKAKSVNFPKTIRFLFISEKKDTLPIKGILASLYKLSIMSLFVEGGAETIGRFFDAGLVDKVYFFIAPKILGGKQGLSSVGGKGFFSPQNCAIIKYLEIKNIGQDILISGNI